MQRQVEAFFLVFRVILNDYLNRIEYCHAARCDGVEVFTHAELKEAVIHNGVRRARDADA